MESSSIVRTNDSLHRGDRPELGSFGLYRFSRSREDSSFRNSLNASTTFPSSVYPFGISVATPSSQSKDHQRQLRRAFLPEGSDRCPREVKGVSKEPLAVEVKVLFTDTTARAHFFPFSLYLFFRAENRSFFQPTFPLEAPPYYGSLDPRSVSRFLFQHVSLFAARDSSRRRAPLRVRRTNFAGNPANDRPELAAERLETRRREE